MDDIIVGTDGRKRCGWCGENPLYRDYHDNEWGRLVQDDRRQFEFIVLESAQAGLAWITILRKREAYREAYENFDPEVVAAWSSDDIQRLLANSGIVRNRRKIEASIGNARAFLEISAEYGSFSRWMMGFFDGKPIVNHWETLEQIPATTALAETVAKEMKARGFRFFGPVIAYAHLQATGFVNDHLVECWCRE